MINPKKKFTKRLNQPDFHFHQLLEEDKRCVLSSGRKIYIHAALHSRLLDMRHRVKADTIERPTDGANHVKDAAQGPPTRLYK